VVAVEDGTAVVARQPAVAHPLAAARGLPHPVAAVARPRQMSRAHHHAAEDAPLPATALGLDRAPGAPHPPTADEEKPAETGRSPPAPTAEDYPGINHAQRPPTRKQAHQHPGCQGRALAHRRAAAVALDRALHGL
jgi:hypothetical protein